MHAEIIAVGTELTSGAKLDTNSQWLSLQLADLGIPVQYHTTVADDLQRNIDVIRVACDRADLVLMTGGLGPTLDDLTREALAAVAGVELLLHSPSLEHIERFFRGRGREMPARNRVQALFPQGAEPLDNPVGTAPGIWMELPRSGRPHCLLAALPGVPSEMYKMYFEQVRPRLPGGRQVMRRARINCFGIGESATEELLGDLTARGHDPEIGITAHDATITLRINASGRSEAECQAKIEAASAEIRARLGNYVYGIEDEQLEHVVIRELIRQGKSFSSLEAGSRGLLAHWISSVDDAAACYRGGRVIPVMAHETAATAAQTLTDTKADFVVFVGEESHSADSSGRLTSNMEVGWVAADGRQVLQSLPWSGNPAIARSRAAKTALDLLRCELLSASVANCRG